MLYKRFNIRYLVKKQGGPTKVAHHCRVSNAAVSQWMKSNSVSRDHAMAMAMAWNLNADWLHNPWGIVADVMTEEEMDAALDGHDLGLVTGSGSVEFTPPSGPDLLPLDREAVLEEFCRETGYQPDILSAHAPEELRGEWRSLALDYRKLKDCSDAEARAMLAEVAGLAALRELGGDT